MSNNQPRQTSSSAALGLRTKASGTQAVDRALAVLGCFLAGGPELRIVDLAKRIGLSPSTVHRIVKALVAKGFLEQNAETDRYYLGSALVLLGQVAQRNYGFDQALPALEALGNDTGESVNLGVRDQRHALVLLRIECSHELRFDQPPGTRRLLHTSSMGKALLAFADDIDAEIAALGSLETLTPSTLTDPQALRRELRRIRARGYSLDNEESVHGVRCVGAPVLDRRGRVRAAIALQAPSVRMPKARMLELAEPVVAAARQIGRALQAGRDVDGQRARGDVVGG